MRGLLLSMTLLLASGCYCSHGRETPGDASPEAGAPPDARVPHDGAPPADAGGGAPEFWVLERRDAQLSEPLPGCASVAGSPVVVRLTVPIRSTCEHGGPVSVDSVEGGVVLTAHVWVRVPADGRSCAPLTETFERHALLDLGEGAQRVTTDDGGSSLQLVVQASPGSGCASRAAGQTCASDCDCQGPIERCPPRRDESGSCQRVCGQPCDLHNGARPAIYGPHFDCGGQSCRGLDDMGAPICGAYDGAGCHAEGECPGGLSCQSTVARPQTCVLGDRSAPGEPCTDGRDCGRGLVCVESAGARLCEEPCLTRHTPCSGPGSRCVQGGPQPRWVCAHVGP